MDFFANAFITRDVAEQNDNIVVKDGIQLRENAISSLSNDIVNCEICGATTAKYKCPGCFCQTCSLKCSKQHKLDTTCSGVRSKTHFVERKQYSEKDMMSDYNFLEEVGRTVDNAARDNLKREGGSNPNRKRIFGANNNNNKNNKRGRNQQNRDDENEGDSVTKISLTAAQELEKLGAEGSGSYRDKQLIMQARKRHIHLIRMADGLKKRKENNTHWRDKPNRILWTIEWLFPETETSRHILEHKNEESKTLKDLLTGVLAKEENKDLLEKYPIDSLDRCQLFFVIPLRHANQPALYPLKNTDSLQEAFKFKKVLEYPTILILGPSPALTCPTSTSTSEATDTSDNTSTQVDSIDNSHHPILKKYTIEEPPTQLPNRATNASEARQGQKDGRKRPNDDDATAGNAHGTKKVKVDGDEMEGVDDDEEASVKEEETSSENSDSDSDSSDSSSEESDSDDDDSEDDKDDGDGDGDGGGSEAQAEASTTTTPSTTDEADLKIGQAILEAFNQDFGGAE
ncbi:Box C/D snoRNA protein 1 [Entomortierella chlamydospora]|nr:Box C/D snoRNA protein 1 [Entomortierella chlamydospora]